MMKMRREAFPPVDYDIVTIATIWPGAPTEDIEKFVTIPLEEELNSVSGIDELNSKSDEGRSEIGIYIDPGVYDKDKVVDDIQRAVDRVTDLPSGAEDPEVFELATREFPIIEISISGNVTEKIRRKYAEALEDELMDLDGVGQIRKFGWRDPEFWVEVDPQKMSDLHVSMQEIIDALRTQNVTLPGGQLTTLTNEFNVRTTGEFHTAVEIGEVIVRANDSGNWLKVKDVATVKEEFEDETTLAKINGESAAAMVVVKTEQGDAINVVKDIRKTLDSFRKTLPDEIKITVTNDFSYYVKRRLGVLQRNGIIGFFLVLIILFLFLDPIPAFMTAIGIPIAIFSSFLVMSMLDISINMVSMLGIILVLGMLVDDGIIVSENVYRHVEEGWSIKDSVIKGTEEVMAPVIATILTTFAFFGPLMFMDDIIGKFIREIPKVVLITLSASLFEAFIILPAHLFDALNMFKGSIKKEKKEKRWYLAIKNGYTKMLITCLKGRYVVILGMICTLFFSFWVMKTQMKFLLFAGEGIEHFLVRGEAPKGTPLNRTDELFAPVEKIVQELPKTELDSYRSFIGSIEEERGFDPNAKRGSHLGQITVFLTPAQKRDRTPQEIADAIRAKLKDVPGFKKLYIYLPKEGPPTGADVEVGFKGENYDVMLEMSKPFVKYLEEREGVTDVNISYDFGKKQLKVNVDEEKAKKYFLTISQIARTVRNVFKGGVATTIKPNKAEEEIDVVVRYPPEYREDRNVFKKILIPNARGNLVPLNSVAKIIESEGVYKIDHLDGKRVLYVTAQVDKKNATSLEVNHELQKEFKNAADDYLGYTIEYGGEFEDQKKTSRNLMVSYAFAMFLCYIILVAMFKSLIQPFIVMTAIPFGIIGVILSFWIHDIVMINYLGSDLGRPLNFFALMGLVGLSGIAVNDSVVLVDFINRLRKKGKPRRDSLIQAGQVRLRPVIMTSVTTIGGLVSVAYGIGGGDPFLKPMALAIVWGLVFSTVLTLVGIPCIYAVVDDFTSKILNRQLITNGNDLDKHP